jgi:ribosome-associated translation inhibitor RaiA
VKEPQADGLLNDTGRVKEEAEKNHTYLSSDQENRVKKAASGFTNSAEILIKNANNEARLLCQKGTHMSSDSARAAIEEVVRTLVDALVRCKDRKKMDEQIRIEEEWIENEVENSRRDDSRRR